MDPRLRSLVGSNFSNLNIIISLEGGKWDSQEARNSFAEGHKTMMLFCSEYCRGPFPIQEQPKCWCNRRKKIEVASLKESSEALVTASLEVEQASEGCFQDPSLFPLWYPQLSGSSACWPILGLSLQEPVESSLSLFSSILSTEDFLSHASCPFDGPAHCRLEHPHNLCLWRKRTSLSPNF